MANSFLVGYTHGYDADFPTLCDAAAGGYGGKTATYVEPGAGERLTDEGLITLYKMTDRLHDVPGASKTSSCWSTTKCAASDKSPLSDKLAPAG